MNNKEKYIATLNVLFIVTMLVGCSPAVKPPGNNISGQNYQVEIINLTEPVYETIRTEKIEQPNCNGTGDIDNVVERTMGINHSIEVGLGLTVDVDGKLELFGTGVDLGAAISNELGYQYGVTESISRSITVRAAPKSHVVHTIRLSEVWESGTARVTSNGESIDIPFRFRANFSIDLLESVPVDCSTGQSDAIQPAIQPTQVIVPQSSTSTISIQLPNDLTCLSHSSGYCGLVVSVSWTDIDPNNGYFIYAIGHGPYYQPEMWWVAGNGVPVSTGSGNWTITDGAYGNRGDSLGVFVCLSKTRHTFSGVKEILFYDKPDCEMYSPEIYFQPK